MKLATCIYQDQEYIALVRTQWDQVQQGDALLLQQQPDWPGAFSSMQAIVENMDSALAAAERQLAKAEATQWISLDQVDLLAPIPVPRRNIICLGWNYAEHAKESSAAKDVQIKELPAHPIVFTKATTTVNGPFSSIQYDPDVSRRLDWEVELGVVIGKEGRHIPQAEVFDHIFGYTVINDISARDLQKRHQQFFMGKSVDGTCPMGPWIVTADEIKEPQNLDLSCVVNGVVKQEGNTSQQIFDIATTVSTLSKAMTLLPGDIIATGTPSGVGFARNPPEYLEPGDVVECVIQNVGRIRNSIVSHVTDSVR